jgi:ABC-type oligopeptide transport system substrate-binding subunit
MITLITFDEGKLSGPVGPNHENYALSEKEIADTYGKFDPAQAKKLLAATAFDTSKEYTLKYYTGSENINNFNQIVQAQLQKTLGLKIKLVPEDYGTWLQKSLYASNFELISYPSIAYEDPSGYTDSLGLNYGPVPNFTGLKNQELQDLLNKMALDFDLKSRGQKTKDLQKRAWELGNPFIPTFVNAANEARWGWIKGSPDPKLGALGYEAGTTWFEKH